MAPSQITNQAGKKWLVVNADGSINVNLLTGDIEIGAVEIKNHDTDDRVHVNTNNEMSVSSIIDTVKQYGFDSIQPVQPSFGAVGTAGFVKITDGVDMVHVDGSYGTMRVAQFSVLGVAQYGLTAIGGIVNTDQQKTTIYDSSGVEQFNFSEQLDIITTLPSGAVSLAKTAPYVVAYNMAYDGTNQAPMLLDSTSYLKVTTKDENENQRILDTDDASTLINYADSNKDEVTSIVTSSAALSRKVTDTFTSASTTLTIARAVADV